MSFLEFDNFFIPFTSMHNSCQNGKSLYIITIKMVREYDVFKNGLNEIKKRFDFPHSSRIYMYKYFDFFFFFPIQKWTTVFKMVHARMVEHVSVMRCLFLVYAELGGQECTAKRVRFLFRILDKTIQEFEQGILR